MELTVLFDKDTVRDDLYIGWGISLLINNKVIFDTGEKGEWLINNIERLGVDIDKIDKIIISRDNWTHWGGLSELLKIKKGVSTYILSSFSEETKNKLTKSSDNNLLIEIKEKTKLYENIFSTGDISKHQNKYTPEQGLVINDKYGLIIIVGCASGGIVNMVKEIKEIFSSNRIYMLIGGFHLIGKEEREIEMVAKELKKENVQRIAPIYCSGYEAKKIMKNVFLNDFIDLKCGSKLLI